MDVSLQSTGSATTVLDLNDDCLRETFAILDLNVLSTVADVCTRFREIAVETARSKFNHLILYWRSIPSDNYYSKLRNFGAHLKSIEVDARKFGINYQKRLMKLLSLYCVGIDRTVYKIDCSIRRDGTSHAAAARKSANIKNP